MKKKFIALTIVIAVSLIVTSILYSIILIRPVDENQQPPEPPPYDPYMKNWESYRITLTFSEDYYVLNYTMEANWVYLNHFTETDRFEHPFLYVVSSEMFEDFSRAVEDPYFDHENDPILEEVYNIITYPRYYGFYYNFTAPYLDNWFIFLCNNHCGPNRFTYHDAIYYRP